MNSAPLLDTHAWIWWLHGDARLGRHTLRRLDQLPRDIRPAISAISLWEVATLVSLGRLELKTTLDAWLAIAADPGTVRVLPITPRIAADIARLPNTFQRDPADRLIVSTSRVHGLPVLTRDTTIAKSGLVRLWAPSGAPAPLAAALPRLYELKAMQKDPTHPDAYFSDFEDSLKKSRHALDVYLKLERQLAVLNVEAWSDLKEKAASHFVSGAREKKRSWEPLFDLLNEAKAFAYLEKIGCTDVHFIGHRKGKTADLGGLLNGSRVLCEVKTINISQDEADRRRRVDQGEVKVSDVKLRVDKKLLKKLRTTLESAVEQLDAGDPQRETRRIAFIVVNFDDWLGHCQEEYFRQIDEHLQHKPIKGVDEIVFCPANNYFERNITMKSAAVFLD